MGYLVLARKYRPQSFSQVVKQDHITQTLAHAISSERVAHAILFSGPRGTGKTTVARILAKAMNCENGPIPEPCNRCKSCSEITAGSSADVFEIDGASNNSVDQIRDLRENIKYMPTYSRLKIYIIDEVHMLSVAAFNALLKTLEEPPAHVMFMFATTEVHKIPITILSRCQRYDFRLIDTKSIAEHMKMISEKEQVRITDESLWLIAREAGGSVRDSLSLLDQVMTFARDEITYSMVLDVLGVVDRKVIFDLAEAVLRADASSILDMLDDMCDRGYEIMKLYAGLLEHFRNLLIVKLGKNIGKLVDHPAHEIDLMRDQIKDVTAPFLSQIFDLLFKEEYALRMSSHRRFALEMVFLKMFQVKPALPIDVLIEKLDELRNDMGHTAEAPADMARKTDRTAPDSDKKDADKIDAHKKTSPATTVETPLSGQDSNQDLEQTWKRIMDMLSENSPALVANLKKCKLSKISGTSLEIEVADNGFTMNMIRRDKNLDVLTKGFQKIFGKPMEIIVKPKPMSNDENRRKMEHGQKIKQEALSHPLVTSAIEIFDGKVVDVKLL